MARIIYFIILISLPFIAISLASAQPVRAEKPRKGVICGHIHKAETFFLKSRPILYMITHNGRGYTLYADVGNGSNERLAERMELLQRLVHVPIACLAGTAYTEVFVPESVVDPRRTRAARAAEERARVQQAQAQQRPQQAPAANTRRANWIPWNSAERASP